MKVRTDIVATPILAGETMGVSPAGSRDRTVERQRPEDRFRVADARGRGAGRDAITGARHGEGAFRRRRVGSGISGLVALQSPPGPVMPGGYDFGRELFYDGIGASGFSYGAPDIVDLGPVPLGIRLTR